MTQSIKIITPKDLETFISKLIKKKEYSVYGVQSKGEKYVYDLLEEPTDLRLDYDVTILPPKKYFLPANESMMTYDLKKDFSVTTNTPTSKQILIGMHPYDIIALQQADKVYLDDQKDDFYKKRRENYQR